MRRNKFLFIALSEISESVINFAEYIMGVFSNYQIKFNERKYPGKSYYHP